MNLFPEMFRSKVSSADPPSPGHDERSPVESSILLYKNYDVVSRERGRACPELDTGVGFIRYLFDCGPIKKRRA
jgi:hypothetical protein